MKKELAILTAVLSVTAFSAMSAGAVDERSGNYNSGLLFGRGPRAGLRLTGEHVVNYAQEQENTAFSAT